MNPPLGVYVPLSRYDTHMMVLKVEGRRKSKKVITLHQYNQTTSYTLLKTGLEPVAF